MKLKAMIAMLAVAGLFVTPAMADNHGGATAKTEAAADEKIAAYVVAVAGGG